jgi:hypothetical protein
MSFRDEEAKKDISWRFTPSPVVFDTEIGKRKSSNKPIFIITFLFGYEI